MFNWDCLNGFKLKGGYKKGRIEKDFQAEFQKKMYALLNPIMYHIKDLGLWNKFLDLFFIDEFGVCRFIEFKKINIDTFNISQFEHEQIILLRELDKRNKDLSKVAIYSVKNNDYIILNFCDIWAAKNEKGGIKLFGKGKYEN